MNTQKRNETLIIEIPLPSIILLPPTPIDFQISLFEGPKQFQESQLRFTGRSTRQHLDPPLRSIQNFHLQVETEVENVSRTRNEIRKRVFV